MQGHPKLDFEIDSELGEAVGAANFLGRGECLGSIKVLHLACDGAGVAFGVEGGDRTDARTPLDDALPALFDAPAQGGQQTDARNDDAAHGGLGSAHVLHGVHVCRLLVLHELSDSNGDV